MSNPLAAFRKHQKILLGVFGVALMIVFTVGGIVSQWMGTGGTRPTKGDPVVKLKADPSARSTETLSEQDMTSMRSTRIVLREFMRRINGLAVEAGATPQRSLGIPDSVDERSLLQTLILSQKAQEMGLVVSNESINGFLLRYTQNQLVSKDFSEVLKNLTQGQWSVTRFYNAMRQELLALRFIELFNRGLYPATPAASWDYFQRLNRQVRIEAVPFNASEYLDRINPPAEAEIKSEYEAGKDQYSFPSSPNPGFKQRKKISLQYVTANLDSFLEEEKKQITPEEIESYYNENKENFRNTQLPNESDFGIQTPPAAAVNENDASSEATDALPTAGTETNEDESTEEIDNNCDPFQQESDDSVDVTNAPTDPELPKDDPAEAKDDSAEAKDDSAEAKDDPAEAKDDSAEAKDDSAEAKDDSAEAKDDSAEAKDDSAEAKENPSGNSDLSDILPNNAEISNDDTVDLNDLPDGVQPEEKEEFKPLEEVSDQIRTELATPRAFEKQTEAISAIRIKMEDYSAAYEGWTAMEKKGAQPTPPNLQQIASEQGLTSGEIPLMDVVQMQEIDPLTGDPRYPIAQAFNANFVPFAQLAFSDNLINYKPREIRGYVRDQTYLYWKTSELAEKTPTLEECKAEVERYLKMKEALTKAKEAAETAAKQIRDSNRTPEDFFRNSPNRKVVEAGPFSWMSRGSFPNQPPQISRIEGIDFAGNAFMRDVFQLKQGESSVAVNNPETTAYLVYLKADVSNPNQLRDTFFRTGFSPEIVQLGLSESREMLREWYNKYEKQLEVEWLRNPETDGRLR
ncbi:MAG: hypothetical protein P8N76_09660 [Pirellulaceae bacterium]|nr:hypothetical protein [Pirellulaceae bacterium]